MDIQEMLKQMDKGLSEVGFDEDEIMKFKEIFNPLNLKIIDKYKIIGLYFYYHLKIEQSIEKLILALAPEINLKYFDHLKYFGKLKILKSLTPNSSKLAMFKLLHELNKVRNKFAHKIEVDPSHFKNSSNKLRELFEKSFFHSPLNKKSEDDHSENNPIFDILEIIGWTSCYIDLLATQEDIGARKGMKLKLFKIAKSFSHKFIARRFSILMYMFQTGIKSGEAPEEFKMNDEFKKDIEKLKTVSLSFKIPFKLEK